MKNERSVWCYCLNEATTMCIICGKNICDDCAKSYRGECNKCAADVSKKLDYFYEKIQKPNWQKR